MPKAQDPEQEDPGPGPTEVQGVAEAQAFGHEQGRVVGVDVEEPPLPGRIGKAVSPRSLGGGGRRRRCRRHDGNEEDRPPNRHRGNERGGPGPAEGGGPGMGLKPIDVRPKSINPLADGGRSPQKRPAEGGLPTPWFLGG